MSPGLDPNFFPGFGSRRGVCARRCRLAETTNSTGASARLAFHNPVLPGQTVSGYVLTNLSEGAKLVQLDLVASGKAQNVFVPHGRARLLRRLSCQRGFSARDLSAGKNRRLYGGRRFSCRTRSASLLRDQRDGSKNGDPLNLVIVGGLDDAFPALVRRGWSPTEQKWSGAIMKTITSALSGDRYVNAPVSDLYLFGRPQDLALQKARDTIHQRNHLRLWLSPMRYHGKPVWVGQISRDIGVRLTFHSPTFTTHKIDPDVDEARTALTEDMAYSQNLQKIGFVNGVGAALAKRPEREPHHRSLLHRRLSPGTRIRPATHVALRDRILPLGGSREAQRATPGSKTMSESPSLQRGLKKVAGSVVLSLVFAGCATWTAPTSIDDAPLRERAVSATKQDARVSVAVLGSDDSKRMFGADINRTQRSAAMDRSGEPDFASVMVTALRHRSRLLLCHSKSRGPCTRCLEARPMRTSTAT